MLELKRARQQLRDEKSLGGIMECECGRNGSFVIAGETSCSNTKCVSRIYVRNFKRIGKRESLAIMKTLTRLRMKAR